MKGLFDPNDKTWQATVLVAQMETSLFMSRVSGMSDAQKTAFTNATNIPAFQVGATDLRGSWNGGQGNSIDLGSAADSTKGIRNATFFAPAAGGQPQIWASGGMNGGVQGSFSGNPSGGTVNLQGYAPGSTGAANGITAGFTMQPLSGANWSATITNGNVPPGTLGITNGTKFIGGAAGSITGTTFSGTASGIAHGVGTPVP